MAESRAARNKFALRSGPMEVPYVPRRGYADGPYGQVHFRDTAVGDGLPLILLPMCPHTSKQFSAAYELFLKHGIRAIGVDYPGFGESDPTPFVPTIEDWACAIVAVLDHLGIEKAHMLGHHTGSKVATEMALQYPGRVGKLILQGPTLYSEEERHRLLEIFEKSQMLEYKADGSHILEMFEYRARAWNREIGEGSADPKLFTRYSSEKYQGYAPFWTGKHASFIYDDAESLKKVQHSTMILSNTGDLAIHEYVKRAHATIRPDLDFMELKGGTGDVVDQMPEEWVEVVLSFLQG